jgi:N-acetylmuramoyl-L-alanine amidase
MKKVLKLLLTTTMVVALNSCYNRGTEKQLLNENNEIQTIGQSTEDTKHETIEQTINTVTNKEVSESVNNSENNEVKVDNLNSEKKTQQTVVQVTKKTIVLDPGHAKGGNKAMERTSPNSEVLKIKDPGGAAGVSTRLAEYEINMMVAQKLKAVLEDEGYNVVMTKNTHIENPGNVERAEVGNQNNADLVLRIHCDSSENASVRGASMLVPEPVGYAEEIYEVSGKYGGIILNNFLNSTGAKNRGISKRKDLTGFNWSKVPVVLIEMGFMSNTEEASDDYQNKIVNGLLKGIKEAVK